jgi:ArsR family transcriptional regulator
MKAAAAVTRLSALAQDSRLAVFRLLVQAGPEGLCVGDIGAKLKVAPATLSFNLKELAHAGLIKARQQSRFIYYSADFKAMNDLVAYLTENCCGGQSCEVKNSTTDCSVEA